MSNKPYANSLATIDARAAAIRNGKMPETYTELLLADQNKRVQKLCSEVGELVREDIRRDYDESRFVGEAADVVYSLEVVAAARQVPFLGIFAKINTTFAQGTSEWQELTGQLTSRYMLAKLLGAAATGVVAQECRPEFDAKDFAAESAALLYLVGFALQSRGLSYQLVFDELADRNRPDVGEKIGM